MQKEPILKISEDKEVHHTMAFVRMNPPHAGHGELVDKVHEVQKKHGGTSSIVLSKSHDPKKNPLSPEQKLHHVKKAFPHAHVEMDDSILHHLVKLHKKGVTHLHMVGGADRAETFKKLAHQYNDVKGPHGHYKFKHIDVHSSGERDPDAEGVEGYSASKMREHAHKGDYKSFSSAAPKTMKSSHIRSMFNDVKKGLEAPKKKLKEELCSGNFKALFLVGGPGSGKDFLIHSTLNEFSLKELSMDRVFTAIVKETNIDELSNFPSVIINGNADNADKVIVTKAILEAMGYDTAMIYVYSTNESSKNRNDFRISRGSKTFSEEVRLEKYNNSISNMKQYLEMFESFVLYDNSNNFITADQEKKLEITSWLTELTDTVSGFLSKDPSNESALQWIQERVLEVGRSSTANFASTLTPGQKTNKTVSYAKADKIVPGPKFTRKEDPRDGDKYHGGVAFASRNATQRTIPEELKITQHHISKKDKHRALTGSPAYDMATTGATTSLGTGDIGVSSLGTGQTYEEKKIKVGDNGVAPQSFSGITEKLKKKKSASTRGADPGELGGKENGAVDMPSGVGPLGAGMSLAEKRKSFKNFKELTPVTPKQSGVTFGSGIGNAPTNFGTAGVGLMDYKEEKRQKKLPGTKAGSGLAAQDQGGAEILTTTLESIKSKLSSTLNNFDQELDN